MSFLTLSEFIEIMEVGGWCYRCKEVSQDRCMKCRERYIISKQENDL
jgi:hypothetical protein